MINTCMVNRSSECERLTGMQLKQQLDSVVIQVTAVQDDLDERSQATLTRRRHRHRPRHVEGAEHWEGR